MSKINFDSVQLNAINYVVAWRKSQDLEGIERVLTLAGPAGSGKSTLIDEILNISGRSGVVVTAPTHKAKSVIQKITGLNAMTIQSILGLKPNIDVVDFDHLNPAYTDADFSKLIDLRCNLLIVDEASMLNRDLYTTLCEAPHSVPGLKILFVGDACQLPPVEKSKKAGDFVISPVFTDNEVLELTTVYRQAEDNPVKFLYDDIRENIAEDKVFLDGKNHWDKKTKQGLKYLDAENFELAAKALFDSPEFKRDPDYVKILCWTNKNVQMFNKFIRHNIFKIPKNELLSKGEVLIAQETIHTDSNTILMENSEVFVVVSKTLFENRHGIKIFNTKVKTDNDNERTLMIVENSKENMSLLADKLESLILMAETAKGPTKSERWRIFYDFKKEHLTLSDVYSNFDKKKLRMKAGLAYGYASTVHKSQGSQYENIMCIKDDLESNPSTFERNSLMYVALSRLKKRALVLI